MAHGVLVRSNDNWKGGWDKITVSNYSLMAKSFGLHRVKVDKSENWKRNYQST